MSPTEEQVLELAKEKGVLRGSDLEERGIPRQYLYRLFQKGALERTGRGLYASADADVTELHTMVEAARRVPHGVICLLSALLLHVASMYIPLLQSVLGTARFSALYLVTGFVGSAASFAFGSTFRVAFPAAQRREGEGGAIDRRDLVRLGLLLRAGWGRDGEPRRHPGLALPGQFAARGGRLPVRQDRRPELVEVRGDADPSGPATELAGRIEDAACSVVIERNPPWRVACATSSERVVSRTTPRGAAATWWALAYSGRNSCCWSGRP